MRSMLLILCFVLGGCFFPPRGEVLFFVGEDSEAIRGDVEKAIDDWNACGGRRGRLVKEKTDDAIPISLVSPDNHWLQGRQGVTRLNGDDEPAFILVGAVEYPLVAHEIGHALGTKAHWGDLMASPIASFEITERDCEGVR